MLRFCCIDWWDKSRIIQIAQQIISSIIMKLQDYETKVLSRQKVSHQVSIDGLQSSVRPSEVKNPGPSDGLRPRSSFTIGKYKYWNENFENNAAFGACSIIEWWIWLCISYNEFIEFWELSYMYLGGNKVWKLGFANWRCAFTENCSEIKRSLDGDLIIIKNENKSFWAELVKC